MEEAMARWFGQPDRVSQYAKLSEQWASSLSAADNRAPRWLEEAAAWRLVAKLEETTSWFDRLLALKAWLEGEAKTPLPIELVDGRVPSWTAVADPLAPLDPDCPRLHKEDAVYEEAVWRHLFGLLRAGQLDLAIRTCLALQQPWRAALLRGGIYELNPDRLLWRQAIKRAMLKATSLAERACLGSLIGDAEAMRAQCQATWQDRLWVRLLCHLDGLLEGAGGEQPVLAGDAMADRLFEEPDFPVLIKAIILNQAIVLNKTIVQAEPLSVDNLRFVVHWQPTDATLSSWIEHLCQTGLFSLVFPYTAKLIELNPTQAVEIAGRTLLSLPAKDRPEYCQRLRWECFAQHPSLFAEVMAAIVHTCLESNDPESALAWLSCDPEADSQSMIPLANRLIRQGLSQRDHQSLANITPQAISAMERVLSLLGDLGDLDPSQVEVREHAHLCHAYQAVCLVANRSPEAPRVIEELLTCGWMREVDVDDPLRSWLLPKAIEWLCILTEPQDRPRIAALIAQVMEEEETVLSPVRHLLEPMIDNLS